MYDRIGGRTQGLVKVEIRWRRTDVSVNKTTSTAGFGFAITVIYLVFEYGRPQDQFGLIGELRPGLILTSLMVVLFLVNRRRLYMAASPQTSRMLLLLLLLALHVPFTVNYGRAFFQTQGVLLSFITSISIILFVDTLDRLRLFLKCWIYLMIYVAMNGIRGAGHAGSSFLQDNNDVALLMNMMLPFSVFLFVYERQTKTKLLYMIASFLGVASTVITGSRGGFVGLVAVLVVIWLTSSRKVLSLALVGVLSLGVYLIADQTYWDRISTIETAEDYNAESRVELWKAAWEMFKDYPLGVGPANFSVRLPEYQSAFFGEKNMWGKAAHSVWFTLLSELGIPGVLLYLSLLRANVRDLWFLKNLSTDRDSHRFVHFLALAFMASIAGFFASGTFLSALYYPHYWYLTALIVATKKAIDTSDPSKSVVLGRPAEAEKS